MTGDDPRRRASARAWRYLTLSEPSDGDANGESEPTGECDDSATDQSAGLERG